MRPILADAQVQTAKRQTTEMPIQVNFVDEPTSIQQPEDTEMNVSTQINFVVEPTTQQQQPDNEDTEMVAAPSTEAANTVCTNRKFKRQQPIALPVIIKSVTSKKRVFEVMTDTDSDPDWTPMPRGKRRRKHCQPTRRELNEPGPHTTLTRTNRSTETRLANCLIAPLTRRKIT